MDRYQELRKENNDIYSFFGDTYKNISSEYVKRARRKGPRKEDTEVRIRQVLLQIKEYDDNHVNPNVSIPNYETFINEKLELIPKKYVDKKQIIGMIIAIFIVLVSIAWFAFSKYLSRTVYFSPPENFTGFQSGDRVYLTWSEVELAGSYKVYYVSESGNTSSTYTVYETNTSFLIENKGTYTFYLRASGNDVIKDSKEASFTINVT